MLCKFKQFEQGILQTDISLNLNQYAGYDQEFKMVRDLLISIPTYAKICTQLRANRKKVNLIRRHRINSIRNIMISKLENYYKMVIQLTKLKG